MLNYKKVETIEQKEIQKVQVQYAEQSEKLLKFQMCRDTLKRIIGKSYNKCNDNTCDVLEDEYGKMDENPDTLEILTACTKLKLMSEQYRGAYAFN